MSGINAAFDVAAVDADIYIAVIMGISGFADYRSRTCRHTANMPDRTAVYYYVDIAQYVKSAVVFRITARKNTAYIAAV